MNSLHVLWLLALLAQCASYGPFVNKQALIVSSAKFHYEVVAFFAHHFQVLGLDTKVWLNPGSRMQFADIQETLLTPYGAELQYLMGRTALDTPMTIPDKLRVLVYVTMNGHEDMNLLCHLKLHELLYSRADRVIMVNHHATAVGFVARVCRAPKCSIFHLSQHVNEAARDILSRADILDVQLLAVPAVFEAVAAPQLNASLTAALGLGLGVKDKDKDKVPGQRLIVVQGNFESNRKQYSDIFQCLRKVNQQLQEVRVKLVFIGSNTSSGAFSVPTDLQEQVHVLSDLPFQQYYAVIRRADFLAAFFAPSTRYDLIRSSSTIPAAIMNEVPVILSRNITAVYPCLRMSRIYRSISLADDCSSMKAALQLSPADLRQLQEEVRYCKEQWMFEAQAILRQVAAKRSMNSTLSRAYAKSHACCACRSKKPQGGTLTARPMRVLEMAA